MHRLPLVDVFFFNDTATTEIYTLSLHDALPISSPRVHLALLPDAPRSCSAPVRARGAAAPGQPRRSRPAPATAPPPRARSEEHTSELQSRQYLVCRLLLEKKKNVTHSPQSHVLY